MRKKQHNTLTLNAAMEVTHRITFIAFWSTKHWLRQSRQSTSFSNYFEQWV